MIVSKSFDMRLIADIRKSLVFNQDAALAAQQLIENEGWGEVAFVWHLVGYRLRLGNLYVSQFHFKGV